MNRGTASVVQLGKGVTAGSFSGLNVLTNVILGKKDAIQKDFNGLVLTDLVMLGKKISHITIITVTVGPAVSPLLLSDAIANSLQYVKAYGGTELSGTPTPSTPATITCNNGILKVKDSELPVGYKRLAGISYDTDIYYETNQKLYGSDTLTITLSGTSSNGRNVVGAYSGTGSDARNFSLFIYGAGSTSNSYLRHGTQLGRPRFGTGVRTLVMGPTGTDGFLTDVTYDAETFETTDTFWIGGLPNSSSTKFDGNIIGNITVSNRLKYIPCERVSDGKIGYYETFTGAFLEPQGTGTPVSMGYDTSYMTEVYFDGTVETINAHGKNLFDRDTVGIDVGAIASSTGKNISNTSRCRTIGYVPVKPNTTYTVSAVIDGYTGSSSSGVFVLEYTADSGDFESNYTGTSSGWKNPNGYTFTTGSTTHGIRFVFAYSTSGEISPSDITNIQLEEGSTATAYQPYYDGGTATAEMLLKVGNYQDEQEILSGAITRNVGVLVLDGTEDWTRTTSGSNWMFYINGSGQSITNSLCVCNVATGRANGWTSLPNMVVVCSNRNFGFMNMSCTTINSTVDDWKQWLAEQYAAGTPVIIVYPLATPTTETVTGQTLQLTAGDNVLEITQASLTGLELEAQYEQGVQASVQEIEP